MKSLRPSLLVSAVGFALIGILGVSMVPLMTSIANERTDIESTRVSIAELQAQQQDIIAVTKEYESLMTTAAAIDTQFLDSSSSVQFFNIIDDELASISASNSQLRLDTPVANKKYQMLGMHVSFSSSYEGAIRFIRDTLGLEQLVSITDITISKGSSSSIHTVTIDAQVPWAQSQ